MPNNAISKIEVGAFDLPRLEYVSLAANMIRSVPAGAFGAALDTVWLTDNANFTCRAMERGSALPSGASCVDDSVCGAKTGVTWLGAAPHTEKTCGAAWDPALGTAECLWDGG